MPEEGARREFLEETRYVCGDLRRLASFPANAVGYAGDYEIVFFWARFDGRQPFECCEGQELRFVTRDEIGRMPRRGYLTHVWDLALAASGIRQERQI
jgi:8-oxo-dGTP pyrophosphatase MutT (NUDIX family)